MNLDHDLHNGQGNVGRQRMRLHDAMAKGFDGFSFCASEHAWQPSPSSSQLLLPQGEKKEVRKQ